MVFSSVPVYLDPPNWQQQPNHFLLHQGVSGSTDHQINTSNNNNNINTQLPPLPPHVGGSSGSGTIRPGSMADRARLAKIPQPEAALKCPRCESTNTKFCYFNNYSLSQPRHFCKTCRRYWTRGGALRNVPVGGGCRRNKKSKSSSSSKSNSNTTGDNPQRQVQAGSDQMVSHNLPHQTPQLPFMASLQNLTAQFGAVSHLGLNLTGIQAQINGAADHAGLMTSDMLTAAAGSGVHQFPFFDPSVPAGMYPFQSGANMEASSSSMLIGDQSSLQLRPGSRVSQVAPVKIENSHHHLLNLSIPLSGLSSSENNSDDHNNNTSNQYWGGNSWCTTSDLSGLNSSSTTNHLL